MSKPCFPADQPGVHLESPTPRTVRDTIADLAVPAAPGLDVPADALPAATSFARWARGELALGELLAGEPPVPAARAEQLLLG